MVGWHRIPLVPSRQDHLIFSLQLHHSRTIELIEGYEGVCSVFLWLLFSKVNYLFSWLHQQILTETHVLQPVLEQLISQVGSLLAERVINNLAALLIYVCLAQRLLYVFQVRLQHLVCFVDVHELLLDFAENRLVLLQKLLATTFLFWL